ncbi:DUF3035 domain-containing protein [Shimia sp.]|uniref:DUF3035 domain-containing protein n=1 Tax=Shimia sp. TaxID=1954381 RepID=UPI003563048E
MRLSRALILGASLLLAACSNDKGVRHLSSNGDGPDEFRILPNKPLEAPPNYTSLPAPTPGEGNRTDLDPLGDAVVALGGSRSAKHATAIPGRDSSLVNYASRQGLSPDIRASLASDDEAFRQSRGRFTNIRLVKQDRYNEVYKRYHLDQYRELYRWRGAGVATPTAPPTR